MVKKWNKKKKGGENGAGEENSVFNILKGAKDNIAEKLQDNIANLKAKSAENLQEHVKNLTGEIKGLKDKIIPVKAPGVAPEPVAPEPVAPGQGVAQVAGGKKRHRRTSKRSKKTKKRKSKKHSRKSHKRSKSKHRKSYKKY